MCGVVSMCLGWVVGISFLKTKPIQPISNTYFQRQFNSMSYGVVNLMFPESINYWNTHEYHKNTKKKDRHILSYIYLNWTYYIYSRFTKWSVLYPINFGIQSISWYYFWKLDIWPSIKIVILMGYRLYYEACIYKLN